MNCKCKSLHEKRIYVCPNTYTVFVVKSIFIYYTYNVFTLVLILNLKVKCITSPRPLEPSLSFLG